VTHVEPERINETLADWGARPKIPDIRTECNTPVVLERVARGDHSSLHDAQAAGAYEGLRAALAASPEQVVQAMVDSGERGRGGAAYPTGVKWRQCAVTTGSKKYVIANGDEGDPGSFVDRVLMEMDPHTIIEGIAIAAHAVGATEGIVYIRSEYPRAAEVMRGAIRDAESAGFLGQNILGPGFSFVLQVFTGKGSYVCGEETAMLNAIEGLRGEVRLRPPYPADSGLFGLPTLVDNVETLCNVPWIVRHGATAYRALGTAESSGTKAICLNHGFGRPGIVEVEFGTPLRTVINQFAHGGAAGVELEAVLMGGPMGSVVGPGDWDVSICYDAMALRGLSLGHGGIVAVPQGTDWDALLQHWLEFMAHESCGKCVPCRLGSKRALALARSASGADRISSLDSLFALMEDASLCAFGRLMPGPMRQIMNHRGASTPGA
jgi:NADH:ubiquinone oxidoreductase subunit F (NADH-binding)